MIAYNMCHSTCLGHVDDLWKNRSKRVGASNETRPHIEELLGANLTKEEIMKKVIMTPNKVLFVRKSVREGIIPRVLEEFLMTRIMLKRSMKLYGKHKFFKDILNYRQSALKIFMVVMWHACGSFTGNMPNTAIADSIIETARLILKDSIDYINSNPAWNVRVVYGDTDSLFIHMKGRSIKSAHELGLEIAREITKRHPYPIELKFEKIYCPGILLAKKRYTGMKYETPTSKPVWEAKGIETLRRDGVEALHKIMSTCLEKLFTTKDLTELQGILTTKWQKILRGDVNYKDFIFAKEVRLNSYVNLPPAALVALERQKKDPRLEPCARERVQYIVVAGNEGSKVNDLVVSPMDFVKKRGYQINSKYYCEQQINAPLERLFATCGVDIIKWYENMPKGMMKSQNTSGATSFGKLAHTSKALMNHTLQQYYKIQNCVICENAAENHEILCQRCLREPNTSKVMLSLLRKTGEAKAIKYTNICQVCSTFAPNSKNEIPCEMLQCPIFFKKLRTNEKNKVLASHLIRYTE